jgi:hypothetical protein
MAAGLREEVDVLQLREPRHLRLAWSSFPAARFLSPSSLAARRRPHRFVTAEELFVALDGRHVASRTDRYRIEVFSVRDEAGHRWVQLALRGATSQRMLTVRLNPGDTAQHAIHTLASWLADPAGSADVFNVA